VQSVLPELSPVAQGRPFYLIGAQKRPHFRPTGLPEAPLFLQLRKLFPARQAGLLLSICRRRGSNPSSNGAMDCNRLPPRHAVLCVQRSCAGSLL
jgi:hypothetical protein